jgi:hypothetical protein
VIAVDAPPVPGVYYLLTPTRKLSYVGKASNLRRRLADHARDPRWENIADVRWEVMGSDLAAQAREADVIIALKPARNRAIKHGGDFYSFVSIGAKGLELGADGEYGCFPHLGRGAYPQPGRHCIDGFKALDVLVRGTRPDRELVHAFLAGTSDALLHTSLDHVDQPHVRHGIERDRAQAATFFEAGPKAMRKLQRRHGGRGLVTRDQFVEWIRAEVDEILR